MAFEKNSSETEERLKELEGTVEDSVDKVRRIENLGQDILEQRENETDLFSDAANKNWQISKTAIDELSVYRNLTKLRLILTLSIFGVFLLILNFYLVPLIDLSDSALGVLQIVLLVLSYFIVNHLALNPISESLEDDIQKWQTALQRSTRRTLQAISESEKKGFVSKMKMQISNFMGITRNFFPIIKQVGDALEHQHLCYRLADSILACLERYNIGSNQLARLEKELKGRLPLHLSKEEITAKYLLRLSRKLKLPLLSLKLVYYDFSGNPELRNTTWQQIRSNHKSVEDLIGFLKDGDIVPFDENDTSDAISLIKSLEEFSVQKIQFGINNLKLILDQAEIVLNRALREKLIETQPEINSKTVLESDIDLFVRDMTKKSIYLTLSFFVSISIKATFKEQEDAIIKSLMVLASADDIHSLRKISNEMAGMDDKTVDLLFVHQILQEQRRGQNVPLRDAATVSKTYLQEQKEKRKLPRDTLATLLKNGKWIDSISYLSVLALKQVENQLGEMVEEKEKLEAIKDVAKYFLSQNTVMQVLESHTLIAYIVLAKTESGRVMPIVDEIKEYSKKDIFWFKKYTASARLGIVPPGMSFGEFCDKFEKNFQTSSEDIKSNLVIHRFTVSEFSSKQISGGGVYDPPWVLLRDLIAEHISLEKLSVYLRYCELINESFWRKPFYEIIRDYLFDSMPEKRKALMGILTGNEMSEICSEFGVRNLKELVNHVLLSEDQETIKKRLKSILLKLLKPMDKETVSKISDAFYKRLRKFGIVARSITAKV